LVITVACDYALHAAEQGPTTSTNNEQALLQALIVEDPDFAALEKLLNPFNLFEALGIVFQELRHSDFLAYLCNPKQNHGLGDIFVRRLLQTATTSQNVEVSRVSPLDFDLWDLDEIEVRREWRNVDLLLADRSNRLAVIIENKIHSGEHGDQLQRYWASASSDFRGWTLLGLYLSPEGDDPSDKRYMPLGYGAIAELVESLASRASGDVSLVMTHYAQMVRRKVLEDSQVAELCRRIYRRHREALDLLFSYRFDRQEEVRSLLTQLIGETPGLIADISSKNYIRFCPAEWDQAQLLREGEGWTRTRRLLLFQFNNLPSQLALTLVIGPGTEATRRRLLDLVLTHPDTFNPSWRQLGKYWNTVLQREVVASNLLTGQDFEFVEETIRSYWSSFVSETLPWLNKLVMEQKWLGWQEPQT